MERWHSKILVVLLSFIVPFAFTLLPLKVSRWISSMGKDGEKILGNLMCFGGGVFFGTLMLHMGPDARALIQETIIDPQHLDYPLSDLLIACGFFLVLIVEQLVMTWALSQQNKKDTKKFVSNATLEVVLDGGTDCVVEDVKRSDSGFKSGGVAVKRSDSGIGSGGVALNISNSVLGCRGAEVKCMDGDSVFNGDDVKRNPKESHCTVSPLKRCDSGVGSEVSEVKIGEISDTDSTLTAGFGSGHVGCSHEDMIVADAHSRRAVILMIALSFHRIFEGVSIGLQKSSTSLWSLFGAVMCHEVVIAFSLGLQFVGNNWSVKRTVITTLCCSAIMSLGIACGTFTVELGRENPVTHKVNGILQSVATGTFIYVTFFEILGHELIAVQKVNKMKVFSLCLGFAVMAALSTVPEGGHDSLDTAAASNHTDLPYNHASAYNHTVLSNNHTA